MKTDCDVVILIRSLEVGGAERQALLLARAWHTLGVAVHVVTFYPGGQLEQELVASAVPFESAAKRSRWDVPGFTWRLCRIFRRLRPRTVYTFMPGANLAGLLIRKLGYTRQLVWGIRASDMRPGHTSAFLRAVAWLECRAARFADLIIGNSRAGRAVHIARGFPESSFIVIPNAIDVDRFRFDSGRRRELRAALGVAPGTPLVGHVARLDPMKDHPTFIRAAAGLIERGVDAAFLCVGAGPRDYLAELHALAAALGLTARFRWLADLSDPSAAYSAMDVFVSSSAYGEGFSNAVGEAMACGLPCVVTAVGDAPDIVTPQDAVVPPGDSAAMAAALIVQLARQDDRLDSAGRRKIVNEFTPLQLAARTAAALGIVLPRRE